MKTYIVVLLACVYSAAAVYPSCSHPDCINHYSRYRMSNDFTIEGKNVTIFGMALGKGNFEINCKSQAVLDSPALPSFSGLTTSRAKFTSCPMPIRSIRQTLNALGVYLREDDETSSVTLSNMSTESRLTNQHFTGLENIKTIKLFYTFSETDYNTDIVNMYKTLRSLRTENITVPLKLSISNSVVKPLPKMMKEMTQLKHLSMANIVVEESTFVTTLQKYIPATYLPTTYLPKSSDVNPPSALETIWLSDWEERSMAPMEHCESLRNFTLLRPTVQELPSGWIASCPCLENIKVFGASNLTALPAGLFRGANALKDLTFRIGAIKFLPDRLFEDAPNLRSVDLSLNRLQTISETCFLGSKVEHLSLLLNLLDNTAINAIKKLNSLIKLDLGFNSELNDLCLQNGYSNLINLDQLQYLSLAGTNVSHLCLDWRASPSLRELDLRNTTINDRTLTQFNAEVQRLELNNVTVLVGYTTLSDFKKVTSQVMFQYFDEFL